MMSSSRSRMGAATARVAVAPLDDTSTFADRAYTLEARALDQGDARK